MFPIPRWLAPYLDPFKGLWVSSCAAPIYAGDTFIGSVGVDVLLPAITKAVLDAGVGREGYTFLADTSGRLIAVPERGIRDLVWEDTHRSALLETFKAPGEQHLSAEGRAALRDVRLSEAPDAELRALAADLAAGAALPRETVLSGRRAFVASARVPRSGWSVAVVQPVDELTAAYAPVRARLDAGQEELLGQLRWFYGIALVMVVALSAALLGAVVEPLLSLSRRVEGLSWANLSFEARDPRVIEVRLLERKIAELLGLIRSARDSARAEHEATTIANQRLSAANDALRRESAERERIETEMARLDKLSTVQVLAAGIAHDFNNLLAAIRGSVSLAELAAADGEGVSPHLLRAERSLERAHALTTQLLTFTTGGQPVTQVEALEPILRDAAIFALRGASCAVETDIAPGLPPVEVDAGQIAQVVQNLVLNAVQAMPSGGVVRLRARCIPEAAGPGRVEIEVEDAGVGIPQQNLGRVFDPFFTTRTGGTGLGLAVCHSIVQKHRGTVRVRSEVGKGTTFTVTLPATDKPLLPLPSADPVRTGTGRVLAMDDDAALRENIGLMLVRLGYQPVLVADGEEALEMVRFDPDYVAIILDLTVPGGWVGWMPWRGSARLHRTCPFSFRADTTTRRSRPIPPGTASTGASRSRTARPSSRAPSPRRAAVTERCSSWTGLDKTRAG
jgi:signal transduction histidine kinase